MESLATAATAGAGAAGRSGVLASLEREGGWAQLLGILQPRGRAIGREPRAGERERSRPPHRLRKPGSRRKWDCERTGREKGRKH